MKQLRNNKPAKTSAAKDDPIKAAEEFGIDIEALKDNLKLSVAERIRRHQIALNTIEKLRRAKHL
jgi:hypothetical protein